MSAKRAANVAERSSKPVSFALMITLSMLCNAHRRTNCCCAAVHADQQLRLGLSEQCPSLLVSTLLGYRQPLFGFMESCGRTCSFLSACAPPVASCARSSSSSDFILPITAVESPTTLTLT